MGSNGGSEERSTPSSPLVRPFAPADEDEVVEVWRACDLLRSWNDPRKDIARKLRVRPDLFLVLEERGKILGTVMAGYEGHRGWINYLAVLPGHRGRGLGRRLMDEAEARLRLEGCPKINLQVRDTNRAVIEFYQALGYREDETVSLGKRLESDEPDGEGPSRSAAGVASSGAGRGAGGRSAAPGAGPSVDPVARGLHVARPGFSAIGSRAMLVLLLTPVVLSLVVLAAHFLRQGSTVLVAASLLLLVLLAVRRKGARIALQIALLLGAVEWMRTLATLVALRASMDLPSGRLAVILGVVAAFTLGSALLLQTGRAKGWFRS